MEQVDISEYGFKEFQIETFAKCNMACKFCAYTLRKDTKSRLNTELVFSLIDQLSPENLSHLSFSRYNEPILDNRLFEYIDYAHASKITVSLLSNGLVFSSDAIVDKVVASRPESITISLQTVDAKNHALVRGVAGDIESYYIAIYRFLSVAREECLNVNVDIGCNFMPPLKRITRKMVGLSVGDNNVSDTLTGIMTDFVVFLNGLQKFDPEFDFNIEKIVHDLMELPEDHRKQRCISLSESIGIKVKDFLEGYRLKTNVPTPYPFACNHKTLGVMADGKLVPCCHIFDDSFVIGDMNKQTLKEALQKNKARIGELRSFNTLKENICKKCYGAPSKRGIYLRHFAHKLKKVF